MVTLEMFDFEKMPVYVQSQELCFQADGLLAGNKLRSFETHQLGRAVLSVMLNIAEANSRFTKKGKRHLFIIARGSAFEVASILCHLHQTSRIPDEIYQSLYNRAAEISHALFLLIRSNQ